MAALFTVRAREIISQIPPGKVTTYGMIAAAAGNRSGARQVARILHSSSEKYDLPWHRVVNRQGKISLPVDHGYNRQKKLLESEGVHFDDRDRIDFSRYLWHPSQQFDFHKPDRDLFRS